jgi:uncharacterized protein
MQPSWISWTKTCRLTPDVNVLVAAAIEDHSLHTPARQWLLGAVRTRRAGQRLAILPMVASGYLRITTNPKVLPRPVRASDALGFLRQLLALPRVEMLPLGAEWSIFEDLCIQQDLSGNAIPDAWIAAAVLYHGEHLATFDRGFRRYLPRPHLTVLTSRSHPTE